MSAFVAMERVIYVNSADELSYATNIAKLKEARACMLPMLDKL